MVFAVVLAVVGVKAVGPYGLLIGLPALAGRAHLAAGASTTCSTPGRRRRGARSRPTSAGCWSARCSPPPCSTPGPIAASLLTTSDADNVLVTQISTGVIIARVPLFLFQAVQAALLPKLARLAARGALDDFVKASASCSCSCSSSAWPPSSGRS